MLDDKWQTASLRITSDKLDSSEITNILGQVPTCSCKKGELMSPRNPKSQRHEENKWILESGLDDTIIYEEHIEYLLSFVETKINEIMQLKEQCFIEIICALSINGNQASFDLTPEIIKRLSAVPLGIIFDIYVNE